MKNLFSTKFKVWFKNRRAKCRQLQKQHQQQLLNSSTGSTNNSESKTSTTTTGKYSIFNSIGNYYSLPDDQYHDFTDTEKIRAVPVNKMKEKSTAQTASSISNK